MTASLFAQYAVIALAVLASAAYVVRTQWPRALRSARVGCAVPLLREGRAGWVQALGRAIAPAPRVAGEGSCGSCSGCDTPQPH